MSEPRQLRRKLVVAFESCAELSDGDVMLSSKILRVEIEDFGRPTF